jgi:hypothetical protein
MMSIYTDVQFIGYAIPSIPRLLADIVDPPSFVEGHYTGIEPAIEDVGERIVLTMRAIEQTARSGAVDASESTLKIFVMPEFSFRGRRGAYNNDPPEVDYFTLFRKEFARRVAVPAYRNWLFVVGTIVNTVNYVRGNDPRQDLKVRVREGLAVALARAWHYCAEHEDPALKKCVFNTLRCFTDYCHDDPVCQVTDKSYVVAGGREPDDTYPNGLSIEKKYISNEDFVLNFYRSAFAEEACGYPPISEKDGENKDSAFDVFSIFTIQGIKFGLEICLDHMNGRLRINRKPRNEQVQIQLIPSCGGQIEQAAVVAGPGGLVFNCDGQYDQSQLGAQPDTSNSIWTGADSQLAHTQLAQVETPCGDDPGNISRATLTRPEATTVTKVVIDDRLASRLFAYGAGEVHIYTSLSVPPATPDSPPDAG